MTQDQARGSCSDEILIELATHADLDAIVALDRATETAPHWPVASYAAPLAEATEEVEASRRRCLFVVRAAAPSCRINGFAVGSVVPGDAEDVTAELESVVVAAEVRRRGIGRALCLAVIEWCGARDAREIHLEVRARSVGPIALYAKLGFVETGRRPAYYRDPEEDALRMRLAIPEPIAQRPPYR